ncbi:MAG: hypothetical protein JRE64_21290, partial [Deltaproteobacteria bacterium]|nr:hypothetical protein [Deltaproteobacteria bacterium]
MDMLKYGMGYTGDAADAAEVIFNYSNMALNSDKLMAFFHQTLQGTFPDTKFMDRMGKLSTVLLALSIPVDLTQNVAQF